MKLNRTKTTVSLTFAFNLMIGIITCEKAANAENMSYANDLYKIGYEHFSAEKYVIATKHFSDSFLHARNSLSAYMLSVTYFYLKDLNSAQYWARLALDVGPPLSPDYKAAMRMMIRGPREGKAWFSIGMGEGLSLPIPPPVHLQW